MRNQFKSYNELKVEQEAQLRKMIRFSYNNVPFYKKWFDDHKIAPDDIKSIEDLSKLPILTKEIINKYWEAFKPINLGEISYYERATGGTTGTPLKYRITKEERFLSGALLYRGWSYAGYDLGDKMVFLGGSALGVSAKSSLATKVHELARNIRKLSAFDMGEDDLAKYRAIINRFKPKFIYGYPSAIYFFAKWIQEHDLEIFKPDAIFTTSEKLYPHMRDFIQSVFDCEVFDGYGANDGGVTAFECLEHSGLHIDMERAVMEVVDEDGNQIENGEGRIVATSLYNYAMPFIRYDTGDIGHIIDNDCSCGRPYKLLKEVVGRSVDILITPEGKKIHGWFFLYIFWEYCKGVKEYQVIQEKLDKIVIKIVPEDDFDEKQLDKIREIIRLRSASWNVEFKFVDKIERTEAAKYKFIINNLNDE
jgi:phenylacetate-CoA ligase